MKKNTKPTQHERLMQIVADTGGAYGYIIENDNAIIVSQTGFRIKKVKI